MSISRRSFLRSTTAAGITASIAGCTGGEEETVELRCNGCHPEEGTNMGHFQTLFKEKVEEKTDTIEIDNYFNNELGGTVETIESVSEGSIDINACHYFPGAAPTLGIEELAFLNSPTVFDDYEEAIIATDPEQSDYAADLYEQQREEADTRVLTTYAFGTRCFSMVDERATNPEEVGGARIRAPEGELPEAIIRGLGGEPVLIDWGETPSALATGVADGIEQILWALEQESIVENTEYLILTEHTTEIIAYTINETTFQDLTDDQQDVLQEAAIEARDDHLPAAMDRDSGRVESIREAGVEVVNEESDLERDQFHDSIIDEVTEQFPEWEEVREELTAPL